MNIQGGVQAFTQDSPDAIQASGWVESLPRIVKFTFDFAHFLALLDNQIYFDTFCHSLTGWYILHYCFHFSYMIWLFRS